MRISRYLIPFTILATVACSGDSGDDSPAANEDVGVDAADTSSTDTSTADADSDEDTGVEPNDTAEPDTTEPDTTEPPVCEGDCDVTLGGDFGGTEVHFDHAYFGLSSPEPPVQDDWQLHIEVMRGGQDGCPAPGFIPSGANIVLGEVPLPEAGTGGFANLLDYAGDMIPLGLSSFTSRVTIDWNDTSFSTEATTQPDAYLDFELSAEFEDGSVSGRVYAIHCDTMDQ